MKLTQTPSQLQQLSQRQLQSVALLQMNVVELETYIRELALDNPLIEIEDLPLASETGREQALLRRLSRTEDPQNRFYHPGEETLDPLDLVGTPGGLEDTLFRSLLRQIHQLPIDGDTAQAVRYLAACLDDDGYLRIPAEELAEELGATLLERGLSILHTLDPPGVGAADLSQCLVLQLQRQGASEIALAIARDYLEPLARRHYRLIAGRLHVPAEEVQSAAAVIQGLQPRPGAAFPRSEPTQYVLPDVFVEEQDGRFAARTRQRDHPLFRISGYYRDLLTRSEDRETRAYLAVKLRHAESLLWAVGQRENTLQRCAQVIVRRQSGFFRHGPSALLPLRMADAAKELEVHESTVSRAVHGKYLQCTQGIYPMRYFFSRAAVEGERSQTAAQFLLRQLIDGENKRRPLSDQKLSEQMARQGCPISRRTVAKYREEMEIPSAAGRKE